MTEERSGAGGFYRELRRRHVVRTTLAYAAVVFAVLQLGEIILPAFAVDADALIRLLTVGAVLLFPVVIMVAWVYEITPMGIRSMDELDAEAGIEATPGGLLHRLAFLGVTVAAMGFAAAWWWGGGERIPQGLSFRTAGVFQGARTTDASGPIGSLAVLPLEDLSAEPGQEFFAPGMHEALISELSQIDFLRVVSRTSVVQFDFSGRSLSQIGDELGVDAVVEGSVLRADGRVRVTVQLIHAASDTHLWSRSYERDMTDVITLQREVAEAAAEAIRERILERNGAGDEGAGERMAAAEVEVPSGPAGTVTDPAATADEAADEAADAPTGAPTGTAARPAGAVASGIPSPPDPAAQEAVLKGRLALMDEKGEQGGMERAVVFFKEALDWDSASAPALMGLAGAYLVEGLSAPEPDMLRLDSALSVAERAARIDPRNTEAIEVLRTTREALETARGSAQHVQVDLAATPLGRFAQEGLAAFEIRHGGGDEALPVRGFLRLLATGRTAEASQLGEGLLQSGVDDLVVWEGMEHLYRVRSDAPGLVELRVRRREVRGTEPGGSTRSLIRALEGDGAAGYWAWKRDEVEAREREGEPFLWSTLATARAGLGDEPGALDALERAAQARDPLLVTLSHDPVWDRMRGDERFQAVVRRQRPEGPPEGSVPPLN